MTTSALRVLLLLCAPFAACSSTSDPIEQFATELRAGRVDTANPWQEARWRALRDDPVARPTVARMLREHPAREVTIANAEEPGTRLFVQGQVLDADGSPREGALVFVYHTGADGRYSPDVATPGDGDRNARLFAWLRTDEAGHFVVHTILPGGYGGAPPHFHFGVARDGDGSNGRQGGAIYFEGDWPMDEEVYEDARAGHAILAKVNAQADGSLRAAPVIRLRAPQAPR